MELSRWISAWMCVSFKIFTLFPSCHKGDKQKKLVCMSGNCIRMWFDLKPGWIIVPLFRLKSGDRDRVRVETRTQGGSWVLALAQKWSFRQKLIRVKYWACNMKRYKSFLCQGQLSTPKISLQRLSILDLTRGKEYKIIWNWWSNLQNFLSWK